jgi:hypothetical protein
MINTEYVYERDRAEFSLGDTLDIKAGLILACLTFLAIQAGELSRQPLNQYQIIAQGISIMSLIAGGFLSVAVLWPYKYYREATPDKYDSWIEQMESYRANHPEATAVDHALTGARLSAAKQRILLNGSINKRKSTLMFAAFGATVVSFMANILTLARHLF